MKLITNLKRPDLFSKFEPGEENKELIDEVFKEIEKINVD